MTTKPLKNTKIICTIGPSCSDKTKLYSMAKSGMNVARLNFSHGTREEHTEVIDHILKYNKKSAIPVAIMLDTKGAEIRTAAVRDPIEITAGEVVIFSSDIIYDEKDRTVIGVNYDRFARDVPETDRILIDNGELSFDIISVEKDGSVLAKASQDGLIGSNRHINLPGADIDQESITKKDWEDIAFAAEKDLDFIALSFIRNGEEVHSVRAFLKKNDSSTRIIAKIETQKAVKNIAEIIHESDAIMVARGDLGADIPFEELPAIQDEIVTRCRDAGKPVIIATHMLESMIDHPVPTRAEVTDTAYAVISGVDSTMLSGETASGKHPLLALKAMVRIQRATESYLSRFPKSAPVPTANTEDEKVQAAILKAEKEEATAFVIVTTTGEVAERFSKFRPHIPIIAATPLPKLQTKLALSYGIHPLHIPFENYDAGASDAITLAKKAGLLESGTKVAVINDDEWTPQFVDV